MGSQRMPEAVWLGLDLGTQSARAMLKTDADLISEIAGMTDGCAAQIGAGALSVGSWNSALGITLVLKVLTQKSSKQPK